MTVFFVKVFCIFQFSFNGNSCGFSLAFCNWQHPCFCALGSLSSKIMIIWTQVLKYEIFTLITNDYWLISGEQRLPTGQRDDLHPRWDKVWMASYFIILFRKAHNLKMDELFISEVFHLISSQCLTSSTWNCGKQNFRKGEQSSCKKVYTFPQRETFAWYSFFFSSPVSEQLNIRLFLPFSQWVTT